MRYMKSETAPEDFIINLFFIPAILTQMIVPCVALLYCNNSIRHNCCSSLRRAKRRVLFAVHPASPSYPSPKERDGAALLIQAL
jgi:hypothetical protein